MDAMTKLLAAVLACLLVSACGGYLQDEAAAVPTECPVVGQALDTGGARLEGVAVTVQLDGARHEAVSDAAGRWRIVMPAAYPYPTQFAGTAKKARMKAIITPNDTAMWPLNASVKMVTKPRNRPAIPI